MPDVAKFVDASWKRGDVLDPGQDSDRDYVVVHLYLVPGDEMKRTAFRAAIESELAKVQALKLHELAFAVPCGGTSGRLVAEGAWNALLFAGAVAGTKDKIRGDISAWQSGDVAYVHYVGSSGLTVIAAAPSAGADLPMY